MEFLNAGLSGAGAGFFTNPMEVVKTRMQLQGELAKKGHYVVHYRNFFHAFYTIAKNESVFAIQRGLVSTMCHQVVMNSVRLGGYQLAEDRGLDLNAKGEISIWRSSVIGAMTGVAGAYVASPFYLVKTRIQAQAANAIAVGHQHKVEGTLSALVAAHREGGVHGLWRGAGGAMLRVGVGSATQLTSFFLAKEFLANNQFYVIPPGLLSLFIASLIGGAVIAVAMAPFDLISTRLYNQGVDKNGKGLLYSSYMDCVRKMWRTEGFTGFFKGLVPCYMRVGPHTVISFIIWEQLKEVQNKYLRDSSQMKK